MPSFKLNLPAASTTVGRTRTTVKNIVIILDEVNIMKPDLRRAELSFKKMNRNQTS